MGYIKVNFVLLTTSIHIGNGDDGKHYWLTPPDLYTALDAEFHFDFDPCPFPLPADFDGLTCEWGKSNYVNPPFGSIIHQGKKKGPTAWVRKAIEEQQKGKRVVLVYPVDKWVLMMLKAIGTKVREILGTCVGLQPRMERWVKELGGTSRASLWSQGGYFRE